MEKQKQRNYFWIYGIHWNNWKTEVLNVTLSKIDLIAVGSGVGSYNVNVSVAVCDSNADRFTANMCLNVSTLVT